MNLWHIRTNLVSLVLHENAHKVSADNGDFPNTGDIDIKMEETSDGPAIVVMPGQDTRKDEVNAYNKQLLGDKLDISNRNQEQIQESVDLRNQYQKGIKAAESTKEEKK